MTKLGVVVIERATGKRWTHSTWTKLEQAEGQRKALENAMPGVVVEICDWCNLPKATQYPGE